MPTWPRLSPALLDGLGTWIAAILTLAVLSAAVAETRVSRVVFSLLIGISVGYVAALIWQVVLWPRLLAIWRNPIDQWPLLIWFLLGLLLLARGFPSASWAGTVSLAYLVGVGVAVAIGGAVLGTAIPQILATASGTATGGSGTWLAVANTLLVAVGTGGVLLRFAYTARGGESLRSRLWAGVVRGWGGVGTLFLLVAFGALFATAVVSLLTLLAARLEFLLADWLHLI